MIQTGPTGPPGWSARVEIRDRTVVILVWVPDDAAGQLVARALEQAAGQARRPLVVGPFYVEKLELPAWYGRIGQLGAELPLIESMARVAAGVLREAGCVLDEATAFRAA